MVSSDPRGWRLDYSVADNSSLPVHDEELAAALIERGFKQEVRILDYGASLLPRIAPETIDLEVAAIHNVAGRLPVIELKDYGAMLFEKAGDLATSREKKLRYYREASYRILWACTEEEFGTRGNEDYRRVLAKVDRFTRG